MKTTFIPHENVCEKLHISIGNLNYKNHILYGSISTDDTKYSYNQKPVAIQVDFFDKAGHIIGGTMSIGAYTLLNQYFSFKVLIEYILDGTEKAVVYPVYMNSYHLYEDIKKFYYERHYDDYNYRGGSRDVY